MRLSQFIALQGEHNGALLLHGALAEKQGCGVILAGPGGVGKTTTSRRMRPPWRSLCDDTTLVVCDQEGSYWAHPWPTWSNFMFDGPGGTWDIQYAVPLLGIFFLAQAHNDELEPMGMGQATCLLTESVEQASRSIFRYLQKEEVRSLRMQRFDNICALAEAVSCYRLRLSLGGAFWQEMERALAGKWGGIY
jgi:SynChlorMet cassette protein ScmC